MADNYTNDRDRYAVTPHPQPQMPARRAIAVVPSDTKDVTNSTGDNAPCYAKALYIGVSPPGDLTVITAGDASNSGAGTSVTFKNVPVGWFPVQVRRVLTATSVSQIMGLYDQ